MDLILDLGMLTFPAAFVVAILLSLYLTPMVRQGALRYGVVDKPDGKLKQHKKPIPYLGGIAIYLAFLFSVALTYTFTSEVLGLLLGASVIVMIGLFDDLKVLSPSAKLLGQLVAAFVLIKAGIMIRLGFLPGWLALALTVLWLVGMTNAINLIDVSDGLAVGVAAIAGVFLAVVSLWNQHTTIAILNIALVGSALGFWVHNRPPASIYLGDTGSMFLGFMLGALAMSGHYTFNHRLAAVAPTIILGVPLFDTLFVMGARAARNLPLTQGSPDHYAVRLRNHGLKANAIALLSYALGGILGGVGLAVCFVALETAVGLIGVTLAVAVGFVVVLWRMGRSSSEPRGSVARRMQGG